MQEIKIVYLKYVGDGSSLPGVPAMDLSIEEAASFDEALLLASGLYTKAPKTISGGKQNKAGSGGAENKSSTTDEEA